MVQYWPVPRSLTADRVRALRARAQLLAGPPARGVLAAVAGVGAVQAQATPAARLAVRARTRGLSASDVDGACAGREVVRTWAMRGTLHMVPAADVRWMVAMLGPGYVRAAARRRAQLGLDNVTCERGMAALRDILTGSPPLTRAELVARLAEAGVRLDPKSQAPPHLLLVAAGRGLVCRGPDGERDEPTYVLLDAWTSGVDADEPADPRAELARRYLRGYAPATVADFGTWSGLPAADARAAFAALDRELVPVDAAGTDAVTLAVTLAGMPPAGAAAQTPRLLGPFDPYLLGYRDRGLVLDDRHAGRIAAGGLIHPAVLVGGRVVGRWRLARKGATATVTVEPFDALPPDSHDALRAEADDIGRFLGGVRVAFAPG
jgi:hypothetical protein